MDAAPVTTGGSALAPLPLGGARRKLKLITKKKARKALKKLGLKMRGGADAPETAPVAVTPEVAALAGGADEAPEVPVAGRRGGKKTRKGPKRSASRRRSSIFGL